MLNKPRCEKAQSLPRKLPLYCEGKFLCAHQYNCPQTRQYENTADFAKCTRLFQKEEAKPQTAPVKFVVNVVPKDPVREPEPTVITSVWEEAPQEANTEMVTSSSWDETASEAIPTPIYTKNVSPIDYGVKKEIEKAAGAEDKPTETTTTEARKEKKDGQVRTTRRRRSKKS